jgi:hypothetical protein
VAAGGFSFGDALLAALQGKLPPEEAAKCSEQSLDTAAVTIPVEAPAGLSELRCRGRRGGGATRYRDTADAPQDLTNRTWACAKLPDLGRLSGDGGVASKVEQLLVADPPGEQCKGLAHYVLRGCDNDPFCDSPTWDRPVPDWWPCATER